MASPSPPPDSFSPATIQDFIALNLSADQPWRDIAHEFGTMLLSYNYPPAQGWFDEGLAEYFSSIHLDDKQVELGADPRASRLAAECPRQFASQISLRLA